MRDVKSEYKHREEHILLRNRPRPCILMLFVILSHFSNAYAADRKYNLRLGEAPLLVFSLIRPVELITAEFMYKLGGPFNFGVIGAYLNRKDMDHYKISALSVGGRIDLVLQENSFSTGRYISNAILVGSYKSSGQEITYPEYDNTVPTDPPPQAPSPDCTVSYEAKGQSITAALTFGKQWFWSNGINVNLGMGFIESKALERQLNISDTEGDKCDDKSVPDEKYSSPWFDFGFGYAF